MKGYSRSASLLLLSILTMTSEADTTAIEVDEWCDGNSSIINDQSVIINGSELSLMADEFYSGHEEERRRDENNDDGLEPSHDLEDPWQVGRPDDRSLVTIIIGNYCSALSERLSIDPNQTKPIFISPHSFFGLTEDPIDPGNYIHGNHHETYSVDDGIEFTCSVCQGNIINLPDAG